MGTLTFANTGATAGEGTIQSTFGTSGNAELSFASLAAPQGGATGNFLVSGGSNGTTNKIVLTRNQNTVRFTGDVTGGTSGSQTLAIYSGGISVGSGDRQANTFAGTIQDGSGAALGVSVDFAGASGTGQAAFVNLSGQNTFTGPLVVTNSKGLVAGANTGGYVGIGGERYANTITLVHPQYSRPVAGRKILD